MNIELPDLKLKPLPEWNAVRTAWIETAEDCLYGHAPEGNVPVKFEVLSTEMLWDGQGKKEKIRIGYGPDFAKAFEAVILSPEKPGKYPAVVWDQFSEKDWDSCPCRKAVAEDGFILSGFPVGGVREDKQDGINYADQAYPGYDWGAIRTWAWGMSRLADVLCMRPDVDAGKLICTGFSRCGKAALAAGIFDTRFRVCAPVCSGAGGCGCFRYLATRQGICQDVSLVESLGRIGSVFPYWWTESFARWWPQPDPTQMGLEGTFPLDSHVLKALIAPRSLVEIEGLDDSWSNPGGSRITFEAAKPAFDLLGGDMIAHFREGGHAFSADDWNTLLKYCKDIFAKADA